MLLFIILRNANSIAYGQAMLFYKIAAENDNKSLIKSANLYIDSFPVQCYSYCNVIIQHHSKQAHDAAFTACSGT